MCISCKFYCLRTFMGIAREPRAFVRVQPLMPGGMGHALVSRSFLALFFGLFAQIKVMNECEMCKRVQSITCERFL